MKSYSVFDLKEITAELDDNFISYQADSYCGWCTTCGEQIPQTENVCPGCETPVVWLNSTPWQSLYGSPTVAIRRLTIVEPETPVEFEFCRRAGVQGFKNLGEAERFRTAADYLGEQRTKALIITAADKMKPKRGRGLVVYTINLLNRVANDERYKQKALAPSEPDYTWDGKVEV